MKGNIRAVIILLSMTGLIGSVATYKVATIIFSGVRHASITYHIDERLSEELQQQVIAYIENNKSISSQKLIDTVCAQFKSVDAVQLRHSPHGATVNVGAHELSSVVNDQLVVTTSGIILDKTHYNPSFFDDLKRIDLHELCDNQLPMIIHDWIDSAPLEVFKTFDVAWFDENNIELQHKKDPQLVIRCAHTQSIDSLVIDSCMRAKEELKDHSVGARCHEVIADVRFDRQIILSKR